MEKSNKALYPMVVLPLKYYLDYFEFLLRFVQQQYGNLLTEAENQWLQNYALLPEDARCAFVRMTNRRGCLFRYSKFSYVEIENMPVALQLLVQQGFAQWLAVAHEELYADVLELFNKEELLGLLTKTNCLEATSIKALKKEKIKEIHLFIQKNIPFAVFFESISEKIIYQNHEKLIAFFRFLFFGNQYQDMTEFVVRDIGVSRFEQFDSTKFVPLFTQRAEAEEKWEVIEALRLFYEMKGDEMSPLQLYDYFYAWLLKNTPKFQTSAVTHSRLVLKLGEWLEKNKLAEEAAEIYSFTTQSPAPEKRIRLLHKTGQTAKALALCEQLLANPQNADELLFAQDFLAKQSTKKSIRTVTQHLKEAEQITISKDFKYKVELGTIDYFQQQGWNGIYVENYVWRCLFGLVFWDIVFDVNIHHPLQRRPSDFYSPQFFENRQAKFEQRLQSLANFEDLQQLLAQRYEEKWGIDNPLMQWHEAMLPLCYLVASLVPLQSLKQVWLEMAKNLQVGTKGFPDILIWQEKEKNYAFIEVKSMTDNLSAQQLYWLRFFEQVGVQAKVLRVDFQ